MTFDVRGYIAYQGGGFNYYGSDSGAYIFRPDDYQQDSLPYNQLINVTTFSGAGFVQEMYMYFLSNPQALNRNASAYVVVRYYDESPAAEWEVHLGEIPTSYGQGREVTVNWLLDDFNNNNTFYTDSNGLEMQKRVLNYRESYDFLSFEQVSGNYYPINSAISIVDEGKNLQFTVLNDRSQGGASLKPGRIELMQNRRLLKDDGRGVNEALNEQGPQGGLYISAKYRVMLTERGKQQVSQQRAVQLEIDEPVQ